MGGFVNTINSKMIISQEHVKGRKTGCREFVIVLVLEFLGLNYKKALYICKVFV